MMMRFSYLGAAAAILIAAPAVAQNNATDANAITSASEVTTNAAPAAPVNPTPGNEATPAPEGAAPPTHTGSVVIQKDKIFPWGLLGLIGLIGLFGRRRSAS
jgi:hypothetical protein